jgi:hypothetical protein
MAHSAGNEMVELVVVGDDVSVPHSRGKMVGRRCLAGITLGTLFFLSLHFCSSVAGYDPNGVTSLPSPTLVPFFIILQLELN